MLQQGPAKNNGTATVPELEQDDTILDQNRDAFCAAMAYHDAGLCPIPAKTDGSKRPDLDWKQFEERRPTKAEIRNWYSTRFRGVGLVHGKISGNAELLDFDRRAQEVFATWRQLVEEEAPGLVERLSITATPGDGFHVRYRCIESEIPGNTKLAMEPYVNDSGKPAAYTLIETRGEGGFGIAPGSPPACHPTGKTYRYFSGPKISHLPTITAAEREILIRCAMAFDETKEVADHQEPKVPAGEGLRPGDDYNRRGPDWSAIITPHGWVKAGQSGQKTLWRRPGKVGSGWSATTGACISKNGVELFAVFSSNAHPFAGPTGSRKCSTHSKFTTYALLNHGGDFKAAARELAKQGYGNQKQYVRFPVSTASDEDFADCSNADKAIILRTDAGNGRRLVGSYGANLRHCFLWKKWLAWDGQCWRIDNKGTAPRLMKRVIIAMVREVLAAIEAQTKYMETVNDHGK